MDYSDIERLEEIHSEILELMQEADCLVSDTHIASEFTAYVTHCVTCAIGDSSFPTMNITLEKAITTLNKPEAE